MIETIKHLAEMALDEAEGACHYAKLAVENKKDHPVMAEAVANLAAQELTHMSTLMQIAEKMTNEMGHETSDDKLHYEIATMIVDWAREKQSEKAAMAKMHLEQYKSM